MSYTYNIGNEADFAKARIEDVNASYKDLTEVCHNIRRRPAEMAVQILEDAKAKKRPIKYRSQYEDGTQEGTPGTEGQVAREVCGDCAQVP